MTDMQLTGPAEQLFNEQLRHRLDSWIVKYPVNQSRSALIPCMHLIQDANGGWLSEDLLKALAVYLDLPFISVMEVATFYTMFELSPVGKHKISVCTNISCQLNGSEAIVEHLQQRLGVKLGETTEDGKFTLREVECLGACCGAPMLLLDRQYHEFLTPEKVDELLEGIQ